MLASKEGKHIHFPPNNPANKAYPCPAPPTPSASCGWTPHKKQQVKKKNRELPCVQIKPLADQPPKMRKQDKSRLFSVALVGEFLLGEGVQEHTTDGNGRAYATEGGELVAEHEDAHADEEHALYGVGHGVRHGVDRVKAVEGHLAKNSQ